MTKNEARSLEPQSLLDSSALQRFLQSPSPELSKILTRILDNAMKPIGVKYGWIALIDPASQTLHTIAHRGMTETHQKRQLKVGAEGITGWVAKEGKLLNIPDVSSDPRYANLIETTQSELCVPLCSTEGVLGIINLESDELDAFTTDDENLLLALANQATIAIETAVNLESASLRLDQLERLQEVAQATSKYVSEPRRVLNIVVRSICDLVGADCAVIYPYDYGRRNFYDIEYVAHYGTRHPLKLADKPRTDGLAAWISRTKWLVRENLAEEDPDLLKSPFISREEIRAFIAVCLEVEEDVVGVLYVNYRAPRHFTELETGIVKTVANQSAIAIYNTRRFERTNEELTRTVKELQILQNIDNVISSTLDLADVLDRILDEGTKVVNAPTGTIQLLDPNTQELIFKAGHGMRADRMTRRIKVGEGVTGRAAAEKRSILVPDLREYEGSFVDVMHDKSLSELAVPLILNEEVIGVLNVESPLPNHFDQRDKRLFEALAGQSVIAIQNAQRFEVTRKERSRFEALATINRVIGGMQSVDEVLQALLVEMEKVLDVENRGVLLYNEAEDKLIVHPTAYYRIDPDKVDRTEIKVGTDRDPGLTAWAARHKESVRVDDVREDPRYLNLISNTRSELIVPMMAGDHLKGMLNLESDRVGHFTEDDQHLVEAIAEQAVLAIEKAERNEAIARQQRQVELQRKRALIGELASTLTHHIGNDVGFIRVCAQNIKMMSGLDSRIEKQVDLISEVANGLIFLADQFFQGMAHMFTEQQSRELNMNEVTQTAIKTSHDLARISLTVEPNAEPLFVFADDRLVEVIRELIANATRAMPDCGDLEIGVRRAGKMVEVWVADTGKGIPPEQADAVWKPFRSLGGQGHGFGLWWARGFVQDLGGDITHHPNEKQGRGTVFTVALPLSKAV